MNTEIERIERALHIERHISPLTKFENADILLAEVKAIRALAARWLKENEEVESTLKRMRKPETIDEVQFQADACLRLHQAKECYDELNQLLEPH